MKRRVVLLLIIAILAIVAGFVTLSMTGSKDKSIAMPQPQIDIIVARGPIAVGSVISDSMVETQKWPKDSVLPDYVPYKKDFGAVIGRVARESFQEKEPIIMRKLAHPGEPSFMASTLPAGMRIMTIAVDTVSGVAGYVFPGDHVDIVLVHNLPNEMATSVGAPSPSPGGSQRASVAEVVISNVKVVAVNTRMGPEQQANVQPPSSVSLEVTDQEAQKLRLAEKAGSISLALRSAKDHEDNTIPNPTLAYDVSRIELLPTVTSRDAVNIVRGGSIPNAPAQPAGSGGAPTGSYVVKP